jgi:hypothetical protein
MDEKKLHGEKPVFMGYLGVFNVLFENFLNKIAKKFFCPDLIL